MSCFDLAEFSWRLEKSTVSCLLEVLGSKGFGKKLEISERDGVTNF